MLCSACTCARCLLSTYSHSPMAQRKATSFAEAARGGALVGIRHLTPICTTIRIPGGHHVRVRPRASACVRVPTYLFFRKTPTQESPIPQEGPKFFELSFFCLPRTSEFTPHSPPSACVRVRPRASACCGPPLSLDRALGCHPSPIPGVGNSRLSL